MLADPSDADYERAIVAVGLRPVPAGGIGRRDERTATRRARCGAGSARDGHRIDPRGRGRRAFSTARDTPMRSGPGSPPSSDSSCTAELEQAASTRAAGLTWQSSAAHARLVVSRGLRMIQAISLSVIVCTHNRPARPRAMSRGARCPCRPGRGHRRRLRLAASVPRPRDGLRSEESRTSCTCGRSDPGTLAPATWAWPTASGETSSRSSTTMRRLVPSGLAAIVAPFEADPAIGCVGGACHPVFPDTTRPDWLSDRLLQFAAITRFGPEAREATSSAEWPFGANMAFRREALAEAGPFSEELGREGTNLLSGDDSALIESVRRAGWKIWLEPAADRRPRRPRRALSIRLLLAPPLVAGHHARANEGCARRRGIPARRSRSGAPVPLCGYP